MAAFASGGIGDQLYHFSQMRALSDYHGCQIDLVCRHKGVMEQIAAGCDWLGHVIDADPLRHVTVPAAFIYAVQGLRAAQYSHGYILHRSTSFKLAAALAGIERRVGFAGSAADRLLLHSALAGDAGGQRRKLWGHRPFIAAMDMYLLERGAELYGPAPVQPVNAALEWEQLFSEAYPKPYTITNLFAQDAARRWPLAQACRFLADYQKRRGGTLLVSAGADALDYHRQLLNIWPEGMPAPVILVDKGVSLAREIALYHRADAYIGVDSFTANLAINCDLPALVLFAKKSDSLCYRPWVTALSPADRLPVGSISQTDFEQAVSALERLQFEIHKTG